MIRVFRDLAGNRTRAFAVRGRRLSRLTTRPYRGDKIRTCDLCVPNAALYQTEPRLVDLNFRKDTCVSLYYFGDSVNTIFCFFTLYCKSIFLKAAY